MNAILVTTSKDRVRLDEAGASKVLEIPVSLNWEDCAELEFLFKPVLPDLS
jgi:tetraacyldisaccharide-1-P 4'-kinase